MDKLQDLITNFDYVSDVKGHNRPDHWKIMHPDEYGKYRGDCEDFALTALLHLCDYSYLKFWYLLITGKAKICYLYNEQYAHAILRYNHMYIDNIYKTWMSRYAFEERGFMYDDTLYKWYHVVRQLMFR